APHGAKELKDDLMVLERLQPAPEFDQGRAQTAVVCLAKVASEQVFRHTQASGDCAKLELQEVVCLSADLWRLGKLNARPWGKDLQGPRLQPACQNATILLPLEAGGRALRVSDEATEQRADFLTRQRCVFPQIDFV